MLCVGICWYVWMRAGTISPDEFAELCYDMGKTFDDAEVSSDRAELVYTEHLAAATGATTLCGFVCAGA